MVHMPTLEEIAALRQALSDAIARSDGLVGELRVLRTERDLLKDALAVVKRFKALLHQRLRLDLL